MSVANTFLASSVAIFVMLGLCWGESCSPANAQATAGPPADGSAAAGDLGSAEDSSPTGYQAGQSSVGNPNEAVQGQTYTTGGQTLNSGGILGPNLAPVGNSAIGPGGPGPTYGLPGTGYSLGTLPPTTLDSFVYNSGYADSIYGDEGAYGPSLDSDFSTIGSGMGVYTGLTTGHASALPSSWGYTSGTY